ncbi:uncharacterized protein PAC_16952 [Phialocephala subalpina]|uniref:DUF7730 domain-containing protein n=1 Tax=Phialocephala subalpina TaxID=576137 RepID=A0A1L7XPV2_9HELO|nr:uncharacterized protein PAC_16952 [Phialocephala subalpina]
MVVESVPRCLLLELPPEIRISIWTHLFSTPTGRVVLATRSPEDLTHGHVVPWDLLDWADYRKGYARWNGMFRQRDRPLIISLSILRTCKQIYAETRGMLWQLNTLLFPLGDYLDMWSDWEGNKLRLLTQAEHVQVDIDFLDHDEVKRLMEGFELLGNLGDLGNSKVRMVTVSVARGFLNVLNLGGLRDNPSAYARNFNDDHPNGIFPAFLEALRDAIPEFGGLPIERRIVIGTGWHSLSTDSQVYCTRSTPSDFLSCRRKLSSSPFQPVLDALKDLHEAFGGELWQDGTLCYKDGVKISQPFKLLPGAEEECNEKDRKLRADAIKRRMRGQSRKSCFVVEAMERRMAEEVPPDLATSFLYEDDISDELEDHGYEGSKDLTEEWDGHLGLKSWCSLDHPAFAILKDWKKGRHINYSDFLSDDAIRQAVQYPGVMGLLGWRPGMEA